MPPEPRPGALRERSSDALSIGISVCAVCDKDRDPLDVPDKACGHSRREHARLVQVPVVPKRDYDRLAAELEVVKNERDLAVLTLAAFTPADKPLPNASGKELANDPNQGADR